MMSERTDKNGSVLDKYLVSSAMSAPFLYVGTMELVLNHVYQLDQSGKELPVLSVKYSSKEARLRQWMI